MEKTSMRKIREIMRLHFELGLTANSIARSCNSARSVVQECLRKIKAAKLSWDQAQGMDDCALEALLYPGSGKYPRHPVVPDWDHVHREKRRKGVTLELLWHEYQENVPVPYSYSQFARLYQAWCKQLNVVMRQEHIAGQKLFVDYAGHTAKVIDRSTGELRTAQIFVAVWGASNYCFAEATWKQDLPSWIGSHIRAFEFFGGVPEIVVPDNLKSGVTKPDRWDPELNVHYLQMARHYGTAIVPARPYKPRDKAKVEKGVQLVENWILAAVRNREFFSLEELNAAIAELLDLLNNRPFKKLKGTRAAWFNALDRQAMKQLPALRYEDEAWLKARVHPDYHVEVNKHFYSVPYHLIGEQLDIRVTQSIIECFYKNNRIASHKRDERTGKHTTVREHMPKAHQKYAEWTPGRLLNWAAKIGPATRALIAATLDEGEDVPQQRYRRCLGVLALEKDFGPERLEAACRRAASLPGWSPSSLRSMLRNGLDRKVIQLPLPPLPIYTHENIRGPEYYRNLEAAEEDSGS
jgi:transposase